jgi:hypothetical protein
MTDTTIQDIDFSQQHVVVPQDVMIRNVANESVNLQSTQYFGLDDIGTDMWDALTTSATIQAAFETLLAEYDFEPEHLETDLRDLIVTPSSHLAIASSARRSRCCFVSLNRALFVCIVAPLACRSCQ